MTSQARLVLEARGRLIEAAKTYPKARANLHTLAQGYPSGGQALGSDGMSRTEACALAPDESTLAARNLDRALHGAYSHAWRLLRVQVPRLAQRPEEGTTVPNPSTVAGLALISLEVDVWNRDTGDPVRRLLGESTAVYDLCVRWSAGVRPTVVAVRPTENDDGCRSCFRIPGTFTPVHRNRLCVWCAGFVAEYRSGWPPIPLLEAHHRGQRISVAMVAKHLPKGAA